MVLTEKLHSLLFVRGYEYYQNSLKNNMVNDQNYSTAYWILSKNSQNTVHTTIVTALTCHLFVLLLSP